MDEIDHASVETQQSVDIHLLGREKQLFNQIAEALQRIQNGDFGICEDCGEEIEVKRLKARPITKLCISCKETEEPNVRKLA